LRERPPPGWHAAARAAKEFVMKQQVAMVAVVTAALVGMIACNGQTPAQPTVMTTSAPQVSGGPASVTPSSASRHSEQVVFSGVAAINSTFQNGSPVGFWIWCEAESNNPYAGECNGSMYFYALGITKHVSDIEGVNSIEEFGDEQYRIRVRSTTDNSIDCTLESMSAPLHGPNNAVHVSCTSPAGAADSNTAIVNVTGSGD
jgi:hypothetical protein